MKKTSTPKTLEEKPREFEIPGFLKIEISESAHFANVEDGRLICSGCRASREFTHHDLVFEYCGVEIRQEAIVLGLDIYQLFLNLPSWVKCEECERLQLIPHQIDVR